MDPKTPTAAPTRVKLRVPSNLTSLSSPSASLLPQRTSMSSVTPKKRARNLSFTPSPPTSPPAARPSATGTASVAADVSTEATTPILAPAQVQVQAQAQASDAAVAASLEADLLSPPQHASASPSAPYPSSFSKLLNLPAVEAGGGAVSPSSTSTHPSPAPPSEVESDVPHAAGAYFSHITTAGQPPPPPQQATIIVAPPTASAPQFEWVEPPPHITEGLTGRALTEQKRRWRKQAGVQGPGKNWRKGLKKGANGKMEPVPGSAAHAAAAAVAASGPSSVAGPSASSARASPYPHGGARMASSGVASPGPAAGGAGGMGSPAPGAGGDGVASGSGVSQNQQYAHSRFAAPPLRFNTSLVQPDPFLPKTPRARRWGWGRRPIKGVGGTWTVGGWMGEQESALETYLLEKRAAAFPPSSSQPTPNPSSAFQPSAGPSSLATPGLSSFSHTTHPLAQGLGPSSSSSSTSPSTTTAEATPQPGFINSHGGGNAAMAPSAVSTAPGSETPTPTMGTPVPVQVAGVTVGGGGEGGA